MSATGGRCWDGGWGGDSGEKLEDIGCFITSPTGHLACHAFVDVISPPPEHHRHHHHKH